MKTAGEGFDELERLEGLEKDEKPEKVGLATTALQNQTVLNIVILSASEESIERIFFIL